MEDDGIYMCMFLCGYMCVCVNTYMYVCVHVCIYRYICMYIHICIYREDVYKYYLMKILLINIFDIYEYKILRNIYTSEQSH